MRNGTLILQGFTHLTGASFGFSGSVSGEVVFNTGMTGYVESLTDPSYAGQIRVLAYPLIGNYGVPTPETTAELPEPFESDRIHIVGLIVTDYEEAFLKALLSAGFVLPRKNILLSTGPFDSKARFLPVSKRLQDRGFRLYATRVTADFMQYHDIRAEVLRWPLESRKPNIITYIEKKKLDLIINIPKSIEEDDLTNDYIVRRKAVDFNIPLITNLQFAERFIEAMLHLKEENLLVKSWDEY